MRHPAVPVVFVLGLAACGPERPSGQEQAPAVATVAPLTSVPVAAYGVGRQRELELTLAAISLVACASSRDEYAVAQNAAAPEHIEADAARAADLRVLDYRRLVARVDSQLLHQSVTREEANALTPAQSRRFDSLRVGLLVARERAAAEAATPFDVHAKHLDENGACGPHRRQSHGP